MFDKGAEKIMSKTAKELAEMQEEVISYINVSPISLLSENWSFNTFLPMLYTHPHTHTHIHAPSSVFF